MTSVLGFVSDSNDIAVGDLRLTEVSGYQELSRPYELELTFYSDLQTGLDATRVDALLTSNCSIDLSPSQNQPVHGILKSLTLLPYTGTKVSYRGVFVPRLWRLTLTRASRVFQNASVPAIVIAILRMHGLKPHVDFDANFQATTFEPLAYCVQYEESDFAFISRLLERHGLFYFFQQTSTHEKIVLTDHNGSLPLLPTLTGSTAGTPTRALSHSSLQTSTEHDDQLWDIHITRRVASREVRVRSYRPAAFHPHVGKYSVDSTIGYGAIRDYAAASENNETITKLAKVRAQAARVRGETMEATTSAIGLQAGTRFDLGNHPLPDPNDSYYVLSVRTEVSLSGPGYSNPKLLRQQIEAVPQSIPFRAEARTPWPKVDGIVHATVDGEAFGAPAPIDDDGSYRLVLPYDAMSAAGGHATRPIKRAQPSAGAESGTHFPLQIGTEVVLSHVDGDPDRPIILGAVPNQFSDSPVTKAEATKSRIKTRSGVLFEIDDHTG